MSLALGDLTKYIIGNDYENKKWIIDENAPEEIKKKIRDAEKRIKESRERGILI